MMLYMWMEGINMNLKSDKERKGKKDDRRI